MDKKDNQKPRKKGKKQEYKLDEIPSSNRRMKYYKQMRRQNRIKTKIFQAHFFLKVCAILALLWLCSRLVVCHYWYLPQNIFTKYPNKNLKIIGNRITPNDKIINALKIKPIPKMPIYLINTSEYEKEIEKLSPVKKAFVRRYWLPARFEVTVEEEIPVITISPAPTAPEIGAITKDGRVISKEYLPIDDKKYKTYKILTYDDFKEWTSDDIMHLKILAQRIEDYSGEKLLYLDIRNKKDVFAQIESVKIRVGELNTTLKDRIERLSSIMPQIADLKRQTEYVDIRWDNTTYLKKKGKNSVSDSTAPAPASAVQNNQEDTTNKKKEDSSAQKEQQKTEPKKNVDSKVNKTEPSKTESKNTAPKVQAKPQPEKQKTEKRTTNDIQKLPEINIQIVEP